MRVLLESLKDVKKKKCTGISFKLKKELKRIYYGWIKLLSITVLLGKGENIAFAYTFTLLLTLIVFKDFYKL